MKGIVLAGGSGSRLWPITQVSSKQLLHVYDKPMIYYPISTLMLGGVREILIITTPEHQPGFKSLLGDGSEFGVSFQYATQAKPEGLAQAFLIGEKFIKGEPCVMILGDNLFYGSGLQFNFSENFLTAGARIFTHEVSNPSDYGVLFVDKNDSPLKIEEKPLESVSNLAITGLYIFDGDVTALAKEVKPSYRGELEITSLISTYLERGKLQVTKLGRGTAWLDTGTPAALHDAGTFIKVLEERTGLKIACLEEIAYHNGWIGVHEIKNRISKLNGNSYIHYLEKIIGNIDE
jgi:glucose-1-phosphate thymidylyltransferase